MSSEVRQKTKQQECIPVGCIPPVHWPYLCISSYPTYAPPGATMHAPKQPCMPPWSNHTCPHRATMHASLGTTMHAPQGATMHAPWSNHAHPPRGNHTCPLGATTHAPPSNHTCPPGATMHAPPQQPCMPPWSNHTCPPVNRMTNRCKNITLPQLRCGR